MLNYDVLVIGSGISGLVAAITAAEAGRSVCVISKESNFNETNTYYAQGGIAAHSPEDTYTLFFEDIVKAGSHYNNLEAVDFLVQHGPSLVDSFLIEKCGISFDQNKEGCLSVTREGAHSVRRIYHSKDKSGMRIQEGLFKYTLRKKNIVCLPNHTAVDLISNTHMSTDTQERYKDKKIIGAYVLNEETGHIQPFFSSATILATGGLSSVYLNSTNPESATGDGVAMAYRCGAEIINSEFVQFHPTMLFHKDVQRLLITEALRGEGARLLNKHGEYFMERYNPVQKDLAPRDEVSRAIYKEMEATGSSYVLLDTSPVNEDLASRFPLIFETCLAAGLNIKQEAIPVVPAAHYSCGGVKVDLQGKTGIDGLYAVGETACTGVHGANRLASVSLLEGLVFGVEAGNAAINEAKICQSLRSSIPEWVYPQDEREFDPILIKQDLQFIQGTMWNYAGIMRTKARLLRAKADLNYISHRIERFYQSARLTGKILSLRNAALASTLIVRNALHNHESVGCHYRKN